MGEFDIPNIDYGVLSDQAIQNFLDSQYGAPAMDPTYYFGGTGPAQLDTSWLDNLASFQGPTSLQTSGVLDQAGSQYGQPSQPAASTGGSSSTTASGDKSGGFFSKFGAGDLLKFGGSLGLPAAAMFAGGLLGNKAGKDTQSQVNRLGQPTALESDVLNQYRGSIGPTDLNSIMNELQTSMSPGIQRILENERRSGRQLGEETVGAGASVGTPVLQLRKRLMENTNRSIAEAISSAATATQGSRLSNLGNVLAASQNLGSRQANTGLAGLQLAGQNSQAAGQIPMQALMLAAILGSKGGFFG